MHKRAFQWLVVFHGVKVELFKFINTRTQTMFVSCMIMQAVIMLLVVLNSKS